MYFQLKPSGFLEPCLRLVPLLRNKTLQNMRIPLQPLMQGGYCLLSMHITRIIQGNSRSRTQGVAGTGCSRKHIYYFISTTDMCTFGIEYIKYNKCLLYGGQSISNASYFFSSEIRKLKKKNCIQRDTSNLIVQSTAVVTSCNSRWQHCIPLQNG